MRRLLLTTSFLTASTLAAALPTHVEAQGRDRPTLLDFFHPDLIVQQLLQAGVMGLRTQMDLVYETLSSDIFSGRITLTELTAWPLPDWDDEGSCEVSIDRVAIRSGRIDLPEKAALKLQIQGAAFPLSCLPPDLREPISATGLTELSIPRVTIELDYGFPASDAVMRLHADVAEVGSIDAEADFAYIWIDGRDDIEEPEPVVFLNHAALRFGNAGLFEALSPLLPPPLTGPGAGDFIEGALGQELLSATRQAAGDETASLTEAQRAFLTSLSEAWPAFVADPQVLVLETGHSGDVYIDFAAFEDDIREVFDTLLPRVALAPASQNAVLPTALLRAAMQDADGLSLADRKRVGLALLAGEGAPRNIEAGFALLEDIATAGDGAAAAALARAVAPVLPEEAYRWALRAGAAGETGMVGLMDRIESDLPFEEVLALQAEVSGTLEPAGDMLESLASLRGEAALRLSGKGRLRSYQAAALWASLGGAAGDAEARDILAEIEERVAFVGEAAEAAWRDAASEAADLAMEAWLEGDLASRFGAQ